MALDGRLLSRARARLARQKEEDEALRAAREAEVCAALPAMRAIDGDLRELVRRVVELTASHGATPEALEEIRRRSTELCAEKAEKLVEAGYPADYLDSPARCAKCGDSGYRRDGSICDCLLALYEEERSRDLSALFQAGEANFAAFSLDYYEGEARECMELTLATAKRYATGFGPASPNLLFQGGTGLGKTFLSRCVAKTVSDSGRSVVYETAQEAFAAFEEQKFSRDAETYAAASEKVRRILNCELLILDDLGTELTTSFTQSALYNILNTRLTAGKKTIISTNLSDGELEKRYIPQITSRIGGEFDVLLFLGRDIRAQKKQQRFS